MWKSWVWKETCPDLISSACSPFQTCYIRQRNVSQSIKRRKLIYRGRDLHDMLPVLDDEPEVGERTGEDHGRRPDPSANIDDHRVLRQVLPRERCFATNINKEPRANLAAVR